MRKVIITVLGHDRPGIVAAVAGALFEQRCNIEDISQTILQTEFAGIFIATIPDDTKENELCESLEKKLHPLGLSVFLKPMQAAPAGADVETEPFVITTLGPDRLGLVAGITGLLSDYGINIVHLKAAFRGGEDPRRNVMIYEVDIPVATDHHAFRSALSRRARELGLDVSLQHRDIFEEIHRV